MSADKIEIMYVEFDDAKIDGWRQLVALDYVEWRIHGGDVETSHAEGDNSIPDDVRVALALLVAPGLVEAVKPATPEATHVHVKSGHEVSVIAAGRIQTAKPIGDMDHVIIYKHAGNWWARPLAEFEERFAVLPSAVGEEPAPDTRGQDTVSDSRSIREGKPR